MMSALPDWPRSFDPEHAPVFAHNEILSTHAASDLWPFLINAAEWPQWYSHASDVKGIRVGDSLALGTSFSWKTLGVRVETTVTEFDPGRTLAWRGSARGSSGYHRWLFSPTPGGGCRVVTEEVQTGLVPTMLASRLRRNLVDFHQQWLEGLVARKEGSPTH